MAIEDTIYRVDSALEKLSGGLQGLTETMQALVASVEKIVKPAQEATAKIGDLGNSLTLATGKMIAFGAAIYGIAQAGLVGTTEGNRLSYVWTLFSRQVASIFLPAIYAVIEGLTRITAFMSGLSGESQHIAMMIGLVSVGMKLLTPVLTMMSGIFSPIAIAIAILVESLVNFFTETSFGKGLVEALGDAVKWLSDNLIDIKNVWELVTGALSKAFQALAIGAMWLGLKLGDVVQEIVSWIPGLGDTADAIGKFQEEGKRNLQLMIDDFNKPIELSQKGKGKQNSQVTPTGFSFESLSASFERITSEANKKDLALDVAKQQLEEQKKIAEGIAAIAANGWGDTKGGGGDF